MIMEYRTWTSVADLPFADEASWLPLTRYLEREHDDLGPVATWEKDAIVLILADDQPDPAAAAEKAVAIVSEALRATGLSDRFPKVFDVEVASEPVAV
jgi:hypothetical protein